MDSNFAFLLPVMMLIFGSTFLIVGRFGSREAKPWDRVISLLRPPSAFR
ncbi:hypothetical protein EV281_1011018 [Rhizobium sp. BK418]|nr:hypothetical protein EV281_1011018 [Rhizobium sp. BK418]